MTNWDEIKASVSSPDWDVDSFARSIVASKVATGDLMRLGNFLRKKGRFLDALKILGLINTNQENEVAFLHLLGDLQIDMGDFGKAKESFSRIVGLSARDDIAYNNLGTCNWELGCLEFALRDYLNAVAINPDNSAAWRGAGEIYFLLDDLSNSRRCLKKAISIRLNYPAASETLLQVERKLFLNNRGPTK